MNARTMSGALLGICLLGQVADLGACGDKFLAASRGTRFQRAGLVRRPASVLVYAAPSSRMATTLTQLGVADALAKVGYRPTIVTAPAAMTQALGERTWDLVLVDLDEAGAVLSASGAPASLAVIAVAHESTGDSLARARRTYSSVVKKPGRARTVVDAVDDVLLARALRTPGASTAGN